MAHRRVAVAAGLLVLFAVLGGAWWWLQRAEAPEPRRADATGRDASLATPAAPPAAGETSAEAPVPRAIELPPGAVAVGDASSAAGPRELEEAIVGRVLDANLRPLPGARVELLVLEGPVMGARTYTHVDVSWSEAGAQAGTDTDRDGRFRLAVREGLLRQRPGEDVPSGHEPLLRIHAPDFASEAFRVLPGAEPVMDLGDIVLDAGARVRGRLTEPGGAAVAGARVWLAREAPDNIQTSRDEAANDVESGLTVADGSFELPGVREGPAELRLDAEGWPILERDDLQLVAGERLDLGTLVLQDGATLEGTVHDARGPRAGVTVEVRRRLGGPVLRRIAACTSDARGHFACHGLPSGPALVAASASDLFPAELSVELPVDGPVRLDLADLPRLVLRARDADGRPVAGGLARLLSKGDLLASAPFVDGAAELCVLRESTLLVTATGCAPRAINVKRSEIGELMKGTLNLERESVVVGHARDLEGRPLAGLRVRARPFGSSPLVSLDIMVVDALTDARGDFVLRGLGEGEWTLSADRAGYAPGRFGVTLAKGETQRTELVFGTGTRLQGRVVDTRGAPRLDVEVTAGKHARALTDAAGRFALAGLRPGPIAVSLDDRFAQEVNLLPDQLNEVELVVPARAAVTGQVRSAGRGVAASVKLEPGVPPGGRAHTERSDADGRFELSELEAGSWTASVVLDDGVVRARQDLSLAEGEQRRLDFDLSASALRVLARDADDHRPLAGVGVRLKTEDRRSSKERTTGPDGAIVFQDLMPGSVRLIVRAERRLEVEQPVALTGQPGTLEVVLDLVGAARVEGRLAAADGGTLPVAVYVQAAVDEEHRATPLDGRFTFDHLPAGPARLVVRQDLDPSHKRNDVDLLAVPLDLVAGEVSRPELVVQPLRQP